jgi:DNA-directed RNA polymerase subunit M/transcription elongation factor TFIIS
MRSTAINLVGEENEREAYKHKHYPLIVRRLVAGWTLQDAVSGQKTYTVKDGVNKCKCGSRKVLDRSMQTRSADEAMTHFFYCTICKNSWKT